MLIHYSCRESEKFLHKTLKTTEYHMKKALLQKKAHETKSILMDKLSQYENFNQSCNAKWIKLVEVQREVSTLNAKGFISDSPLPDMDEELQKTIKSEQTIALYYIGNANKRMEKTQLELTREQDNKYNYNKEVIQAQVDYDEATANLHNFLNNWQIIKSVFFTALATLIITIVLPFIVEQIKSKINKEGFDSTIKVELQQPVEFLPINNKEIPMVE